MQGRHAVGSGYRAIEHCDALVMLGTDFPVHLGGPLPADERRPPESPRLNALAVREIKSINSERPGYIGGPERS